MHRSLLFALSVFFISAVAHAEDAPAIVERDTLAPQFLQVSEINLKERRIVVQETIFKPVSVERVITREEGGVTKTINVTMIVCIPEIISRTVEYDALVAVHPSGKAVAAARLAEAGKTTPLCLVATDESGNISAKYAKLLRDDTILLLAKAKVGPAIPPPFPPGE